MQLGDPVTSQAGDLEPELGWWEVIVGGVAGKGSLLTFQNEIRETKAHRNPLASSWEEASQRVIAQTLLVEDALLWGSWLF